jgi:hypothetical protein
MKQVEDGSPKLTMGAEHWDGIVAWPFSASWRMILAEHGRREVHL